MDGVLGTTWRRTGSSTVGQAPSPFDTKCNATYAASRATRRRRRARISTAPSPDSVGSSTCSRRPPPRPARYLTVASFTKALQGVKNFQMGYGGTGSFGPKKFDAPDEVRTLKYQSACNCWVPTSAYQPVRF